MAALKSNIKLLISVKQIQSSHYIKSLIVEWWFDFLSRQIVSEQDTNSVVDANTQMYLSLSDGKKPEKREGHNMHHEHNEETLCEEILTSISSGQHNQSSADFPSRHQTITPLYFTVGSNRRTTL